MASRASMTSGSSPSSHSSPTTTNNEIFCNNYKKVVEKLVYYATISYLRIKTKVERVVCPRLNRQKNIDNHNIYL